MFRTAKKPNDEGLKSLVAAELLTRLILLEPRIEERDLLFFGARCDIAVPLGVKYGLDIDSERVYNIVNGRDPAAFPSFSEAYSEGGFLNLTASDATLERLVSYALELFEPRFPEGAFETGSDVDPVRARLIAIAETSSENEDPVPRDALMRRALWRCLMANSPSSKAGAAELADRAIARHRRSMTLGDKGGRLPGTCALAMAACLGGVKKNKDRR